MHNAAPSDKGGAIDIHAAFGQHLLQLTVTDAVFAVSACRPQDNVTLKMATLEWIHVLLRQQKGDDQFITVGYLQQCRFIRDGFIRMKFVQEIKEVIGQQFAVARRAKSDEE